MSFFFHLKVENYEIDVSVTTLYLRKSRNYVTFLMNKARQDYYSDLIFSNDNDLRHLFKVSKNLLNITSTPVFCHRMRRVRTNSNSLTRWAHFSIERLLISVPTSIIIHHKFAELAPVTAILISLCLICYLRRRCMT